MENLLAQIRDGKLAPQAEQAVVQGIMPMEPAELITAIYFICNRTDSLLDTARETFTGLPNGMKVSYFEDKTIESEILDFFLRNFPIPTEAKSAAILNPHTPGQAIEAVASDLEADLMDLAVNNQMKILEAPGIIEALRRNSNLTIVQKRKLEEYEVLLLKDPVSPAEELEGKDLAEVEKEAIEEAKQFVKTFGREHEHSEDAKESTSGRQKTTVLEQLSNMTVPQKVQAAIKGNREVRTVLVKDANKLVCTAVMRSPKITEAEVEFFANLRNVQTEVLRMIATNREWLKNYKTVVNLVKNPRTPLPYTIKLLSRLHKNDMRLLMRDKGIPEALRTMARKRFLANR